MLVLVGMGVDSLSMSVGSLLRVKRVMRSLSQQEQQLSSEALGLEIVEDIRMLFNEALEHAGIGGLVQAGK